MVSVVLSAFMGGLGLGSNGDRDTWRAGLEERIECVPAVRLYALTELLIGIAAQTVPLELSSAGDSAQGHCANHQFRHSAIIWRRESDGPDLVPWCACMGATFRSRWRRSGGGRAGTGAVIQLSLPGERARRRNGRDSALATIEYSDFAGLCWWAPDSISARGVRVYLTLGESKTEAAGVAEERVSSNAGVDASSDAKLLWLLFGTGLTSMGAEVVWVRIYTPSLGTFVYAFAAILGIYLVGTYVGSWIYRRMPRTQALDNGLLWLVFGILVLFAFLTADPRVPIPGILRVLLGITPFAGMAGFITPMILDRFSAGDPDRAGTAYAINIAGCVLGPLVAGFLLLPALGERLALCLLALPWLISGLSMQLAPSVSFRGRHAGVVSIFVDPGDRFDRVNCLGQRL